MNANDQDRFARWTDLDNQAHLSVQVQQIRRVSVHRELGLDLVEDGFLGDPVDGEVHFRLVVVATCRGSLYADDVPACAVLDVFLELGPVLLVVMARLAHAGAQDPDLVIVVLVYGLDGRGEGGGRGRPSSRARRGPGDGR